MHACMCCFEDTRQGRTCSAHHHVACYELNSINIMGVDAQIQHDDTGFVQRYKRESIHGFCCWPSGPLMRLA